MRYLFLLFLSIPFLTRAQLADTIQLPMIIPAQWTVYISPSGNDLSAGDSINPVATFTRALDKLDSLSLG